jgi:hypothetical protein
MRMIISLNNNFILNLVNVYLILRHVLQIRFWCFEQFSAHLDSKSHEKNIGINRKEMRALKTKIPQICAAP